MIFKGDIVILDPVKILRCDEDWDKSEYCTRPDLLGIEGPYIVCQSEQEYLDSLVYKNNSDLSEEQIRNLEFNIPDEDNVLGEFDISSGILGVFMLHDIEKHYNPGILGLVQNNPDIIFRLPEFDGDIKILIDPETNRKIQVVGNGNINFYTVLK